MGTYSKTTAKTWRLMGWSSIAMLRHYEPETTVATNSASGTRRDSKQRSAKQKHQKVRCERPKGVPFHAHTRETVLCEFGSESLLEFGPSNEPRREIGSLRESPTGLWYNPGHPQFGLSTRQYPEP